MIKRSIDQSHVIEPLLEWLQSISVLLFIQESHFLVIATKLHEIRALCEELGGFLPYDYAGYRWGEVSFGYLLALDCKILNVTSSTLPSMEMLAWKLVVVSHEMSTSVASLMDICKRLEILNVCEQLHLKTDTMEADMTLYAWVGISQEHGWSWSWFWGGVALDQLWWERNEPNTLTVQIHPKCQKC